MAGSEDELKSLLMKEESEKVGLKLFYVFLKLQKTKIMVSGPINLWQIDEEITETVRDFIFLGSSHEIKRCLLLGRKAVTNLGSIF